MFIDCCVQFKLSIMMQIYRVAQNKLDYFFVFHVLYFYNKTCKYDNVRTGPRTLVKAVLNVSSTGCNKERQSFAKLSYSAIDNILTNLLRPGLQDFFQVLTVSNATTMVKNLLECSPNQIVHWV